jgi:hypothetical protein
MRNRHVDDSDIFDEHGLLRPGKTYRASMTLMDGMPPRILARHRPGFVDAATNDARRERAYDTYETDLTNAWRKDAYEEWGEEGDQCTVRDGGVEEGGPGHLRRINGRLVCVPDRRGSDTRDHATTMAELYDAYDRTLSLAWRQP